MNLLELIFKQMRQRFLSTMLTILSIFLGMALATSIMIVRSEGHSIFAQTDYGCDMIVGPRSSSLSLVLNTLYHMDVSPGNIPYSLYEDMVSGKPTSADGKPNMFVGRVQWAVPYMVGDSYQGHRIVGTTPQLFGVNDEGQPLPPEKVPEYRLGQKYSIAQGRVFHPRKFEAVIGSEVAKDLKMTIGQTFQAMHGVPGREEEEHAEVWTVVGILNETHTTNDRIVFISLISSYAIFEHEAALEDIQKRENAKAGLPAEVEPAPAVMQENADKANMKAYHFNADGTIAVDLPKQAWEISAILVKTKSISAFLSMQADLRNFTNALGVNPAGIMRDFFDTILARTFQILFLISSLVLIVGAVSILVSIYNSVSARMREIAIMRALGATREKILAIVCLEAGMVGLIGGLLGLIAGHVLAAIGSAYLQSSLGTGIVWYHFDGLEMLYLSIVILVSLLAGLVPAMKAYRAPVAENLVAS